MTVHKLCKDTHRSRGVTPTQQWV